MTAPFVVALLLLSAGASSGVPNRRCNAVQEALSARGIRPNAPPPLAAAQMQGASGPVCPNGLSVCCGPNTVGNLMLWSDARYVQDIGDKSREIMQVSLVNPQKVDEFVTQLIGNSQAQLHSIFTKTYGVLYERNAFLFKSLFEDLGDFYFRGRGNLKESIENFFRELYEKMFQVMNSQYSFDQKYLTCVSENMREQKPFGDVPGKLAGSVHRSMVAIRGLSKALRSAISVSQKLHASPPSEACLAAVRKMNVCPTCSVELETGGQPHFTKPCANYCINVMKGCLAHHIEAQEAWDTLIDSISKLTDRLTGPFNVEAIILPLDIQISDAIMNFQDSGFHVTQKVFDTCGTPRIIQRRDAADWHASHLDTRNRRHLVRRSSPATTHRSGKSDFERLIGEIKKTIRLGLSFWTRLPYEICIPSMKESDDGLIPTTNPTLLPDTEPASQCWNGTTTGHYRQPIADLKRRNPEVRVSDTPEEFGSSIELLRTISDQLERAYHGEEVSEWWSADDDQPYLHSGSSGNRGGKRLVTTRADSVLSHIQRMPHSMYAEGSGSGDHHSYMTSDDEDDPDSPVEGSGLGPDGSGNGCDDEEGCQWSSSHWPPWSTTSRPVEEPDDDPIIIIGGGEDETATDEPPESGGSGAEASGVYAIWPLALSCLITCLML